MERAPQNWPPAGPRRPPRRAECGRFRRPSRARCHEARRFPAEGPRRNICMLPETTCSVARFLGSTRGISAGGAVGRTARRGARVRGQALAQRPVASSAESSGAAERRSAGDQKGQGARVRRGRQQKTVLLQARHRNRRAALAVSRRRRRPCTAAEKCTSSGPGWRRPEAVGAQGRLDGGTTSSRVSRRPERRTRTCGGTSISSRAAPGSSPAMRSAAEGERASRRRRGTQARFFRRLRASPAELRAAADRRDRSASPARAPR